MSKQRVVIFHDPEQRLSLNAITAGRANAPLATLTQMNHPRTGKPALYFMSGEDILELQVVKADAGQFASYFLDQRVQADGAVYVASRVDPTLLLLPHLREHAARWCPLNQLLADAGCLGLRGCRHLAVDRVCDVSDRLGDAPDELLFKASEEKTLAWLRAKVERARLALASGGGIGNSGGSGGSSSGGAFGGFSPMLQTQAPAAEPLDAGSSVQQARLLAALGLVCEYLNGEWGEMLSESYGVKVGDVFQTAGAAAAKKRAAAWEGGEEEDRNLQLTQGPVKPVATGAAGGAKGGSGATAKGGAAKAKGKVQPAAKKAKVDIKGMRSIGSFFGKKS